MSGHEEADGVDVVIKPGPFPYFFSFTFTLLADQNAIAYKTALQYQYFKLK